MFISSSGRHEVRGQRRECVTLLLTTAGSYRQEAVLSLVWRSVTVTPPVILSLALRRPVTDRPHPGQLLNIAGSHLQTTRESSGLAGSEDVVGRGEPDVHYLECFVRVRVEDFVYGGVPVEGLVLLHVAGVSRGTPQVLEGDAGPHSPGGDGPIEPVDMVAQAVPSLGEHQGVRPHCTGGQEVHLNAGGEDQHGERGEQQHGEQHGFTSVRTDEILWENCTVTSCKWELW